MKKIVCLLLALVMCLFLCACGGKNSEQGGGVFGEIVEETQDPIIEEIAAQLIGTWYYELPNQDSLYPKYIILDFNDKGYYNYFSVIAYPSGHKVDYSSNSTYEVSADLVKCNIVGESGDIIGSFDYIPTFENDTFKLIQKGHNVECVKGDWLDYLEQHR